MFKQEGLCDPIEDWVTEQRMLFRNKKMIQENIDRLNAVDFPFTKSDNEKFRLLEMQAYEMQEYLQKGILSYDNNFSKKFFSKNSFNMSEE